MSTAMPQGFTNIPSQLADLLSCQEFASLYTEKFSTLFSSLPQELSSQFSNRLVSLFTHVRTSLPSALTVQPPEIFSLPRILSDNLAEVINMITVILSTMVTTVTITDPSDHLGDLFCKSITALHTALYANAPSNLPDLLYFLEDALNHATAAQPYSTLTSFPSEVSSLLSNTLPSDLHPLSPELVNLLTVLMALMCFKLKRLLNHMNQGRHETQHVSPAAAHNQLEKKTDQYVYQTREDADTDPDTCPICLEDMKDGDNARRLDCSHFFHLPCIDHWLETKTRCPLCQRHL